jgi:hypothetical protein
MKPANNNALDISDLSDLVECEVDETSKTHKWLRPVYFGIPVPPHPAHEPLPPRRKPTSLVETLTGRRSA